jgi:hypothetical protein
LNKQNLLENTKENNNNNDNNNNNRINEENFKNKINLISNIMKITLEKIENLLSEDQNNNNINDNNNNNEEILLQLKSILVENLFKYIQTEENLMKIKQIKDTFFTESYLFLTNFCIKNFDLKISSMKNLLEKTFNDYIFNPEILKLAFSNFNKTEILKNYLNLYWDYNTLIKNFNNDEILEKIFLKISKISKISNEADCDLTLFIKLIVENLFNVKFFIKIFLLKFYIKIFY